MQQVNLSIHTLFAVSDSATIWNFEFTYRHRALNPDDVKELQGATSAEQERVMHFRYVPPFTIVTSVRYLTTGVLDVVLVSASPEAPRTCRIYSMLIGSDAAIDPTGAQEYEEKIILEYRLLLEKYPDDGMPLGPSAQFHSRADRMTVECRRILTDIVRRHRETHCSGGRVADGARPRSVSR